MTQKYSCTMTRLQTLQSSVKWYHMDYKANILLDTYSGLLSDQCMILAMNSSFVDPFLQFEAQLKIIEVSFKKVFSLPSFSKVKSMGKTAEEIEDLENLYKNIFRIYEDTLLILVHKDFYKLQIIKEMILWMVHDLSYLQERVMLLINRVLVYASRKARKFSSVDAPCLGILAAEMSLLCSYNNPTITQQASTGINYILSIAACQNSMNMIKRKMPKPIVQIRTSPGSATCDFELPFKILQGSKEEIAQSIGQALMPSLLTDFAWTLLKKLSVTTYEIASEAASLLKLILEYHAQKITRVSKIVDDIYKQLCGNETHIMKNSLLQIITLLTHASPKKVIFQLMDYPVPADKTLLQMWQAAGSEPNVASQVLMTVLLILRGKPGDMEETSGERRRFSLDSNNMMPVAASQALCIFLRRTSYCKVVGQFFPKLLMALMFQLFYCKQPREMPQDRIVYIRDALRALLISSGLEKVDSSLDKKNFWDHFSHILDHQYGIHLIAKTLSEYNFPQFPETLHYVYKVAMEGSRRSEDSIVTIIFFTELLNNFFKESFPEEFLALFRNWVNDSNPSVGKMSLQKIASMAPAFNEIENACGLLFPVLDAFNSKEDTVIIRAMLTLRNILRKLNRVIYSSMCVRIASSYSPLLDHNSSSIQCMAIWHFGELLADMNEYAWMLNHVVLGSLVPLILFLESNELRISNACKHTLKICAVQLKWSTSHLLQTENYNFELMVLSICNHLLFSRENYITDLISDALGFLGSSRAFLRRGAVILIGYLGKAGAHLLLRDEINVILEVVDRVTRDEDPTISTLAEMTHALFMEIAFKISSSAVKQTLRRWLKFIYVKKLRPIYNLSMDQSSKTVLLAELKKVEEDQIEDDDEESKKYSYILIRAENIKTLEDNSAD